MSKPYRTDSNGKLIKSKNETETSFAIQWRAILVRATVEWVDYKGSEPSNPVIRSFITSSSVRFFIARADRKEGPPLHLRHKIKMSRTEKSKRKNQ